MNSDCLSKAEILNSIFSSVFVTENATDIPDLPDRNFNDELRDIVVTPKQVEKQLFKLNSSKSPGQDQMHPRVLKELSPIVSETLAALFNKSISIGRLPKQWK